MAERRRRNLSPETREKLSRMAMQRHAEGTFGAPPAGFKTRKTKRREAIQRRVAEEARIDENARAIIQVFKDAIDPSQRIETRIKGATAWVEIAQKVANFELQSDVHDRQDRSREEILEVIRAKLTSGPAAAILQKQLEEQTIVEAQVVEDE